MAERPDGVPAFDGEPEHASGDAERIVAPERGEAPAQFHTLAPPAAPGDELTPAVGGKRLMPESVVESLRRDLVDRLGSQPPSAFVAQESLLIRFRRRLQDESPQPLIIGAVAVIAIVAVLIALPMVLRGHSAAKAGAAATAATPVGQDASFIPVAAAPTTRPTARPAATPGFRGPSAIAPANVAKVAPSVSPTATGAAPALAGTRPAATPPVTRARTAPFLPPSGAAGATNANQAPPVVSTTSADPSGNGSLANLVTNAASAPPPAAPPVQVGSTSPGVVASRTSPPPVAVGSSAGGFSGGYVPPAIGSGGGAGASAAAAQPAAPAEPAPIAPVINSAASSAQRAAAAAAAHGQPTSAP
ncbi:MAG: hypothetical protein ACYDCQ_17185 [Dehalococcoidia bacterium]